MNNAYLFILLIYGFLIPVSYRNKNNHTKVVNSCSWLATNTKQRYLYSSQTRRATTFQSYPPGDGKESLPFLLVQRQSARFWTSRASVQIPHPVCCFFPVLSSAKLNPKYVSSNPPVPAFLLLFFHAVLLHCCCTVVHTWWVRGWLVDGFFCCAMLYCCTHMVGG